MTKDYKDQAEVTEVLRAKGFCGTSTTSSSVCCKMLPCPVHPETLTVKYRDLIATLQADQLDDNMYEVTVFHNTPLGSFQIVLRCKVADDLYTLLGQLPRGARMPDVRKDVVIGQKCIECTRAATHAEHYYNTVRTWCDDHVKMSGHYEVCHPGQPDDPCKKLLAELNAK